MEKRYFEKVKSQKDLLVEKDRITDLNDKKWAHPDGAELFVLDPALNASSRMMYDPNVPLEEKIRVGTQKQKGYMDEWWGRQHSCDITEHIVSGCPEEPETPATVWVVKPKTARPGKNRVMFYVIGGGIYSVNPNAYPIEMLCEKYNAVGIVVIYRMSWQAQYPAAINDLHAGYQWMTEHADEIGIHPNKVVLTGCSSGAHLALSLAFRLKRYGHSPRGIVTVSAQVDDRELDGEGWYTGIYDTIDEHDTLMQYLGRNFNSVLVGPEAMPNHATVEDCIGYPPVFMHQSELDPDILRNLEFYGKLVKARSFAELHLYGGSIHNNSVWAGIKATGELNAYSRQVADLYYNEIEYCYKFDLRRPWVVDEYKEFLKKRFNL